MKNQWILVLLVCLVTVMFGVAVGQPVVDKVLKDWQDVVMQPTKAWRDTYGGSDDSLLAYNAARLVKGVEAQARALGLLKREIVALKKQVEDLKAKVAEMPVVDINDLNIEAIHEVTDPNDGKN